jgi:hypothetical protein
MEKLSQYSKSANKSDLSNAIIEEFSNFKSTRSKKALQAIHSHIVEFFNLDELQGMYGELIANISKKIILIMNHKKRSQMRFATSKQQFDTLKAFETNRCYDTNSTMAGML